MPDRALIASASGVVGSNLADNLVAYEWERHGLARRPINNSLGPFEAYGKFAIETPFREDTLRLPVENFYYDQEDELMAGLSGLDSPGASTVPAPSSAMRLATS